jgi:hypothetical protein
MQILAHAIACANQKAAPYQSFDRSVGGSVGNADYA